ncbi:FUSC family protein [Flavobacterium agricola]|uniref:FUSC family protein n=1 Tax=Flavobacterium agricola TaxID=2870839 RepID=A0ABY6M1R4_9FLAO|nr:FUSC family membrane protein [Flavobacterium agricola]UYW02371.1 FUSC family protein [Flavobacterium agricola]
MNNIQQKTNQFYTSFLYKINEDSFNKSLKVIVSALIAFFVFYHKFGSTVAMCMILGICFSSPSDIGNNLKEKASGIILAATLVPLFSVILTVLYGQNIFFYFIFAVLVFISGIISLYGQRANQLSFTLLMGISLSFIHIADKNQAVANGLYMCIGGLIYLLVTTIFYFIRPSKSIDQTIADSIKNVSDFLQIRSKFLNDDADLNALKNEQLALQVKSNDSFQKISQYISVNHKRIINSSENRKVVLSYTFLNQIMELALSTTYKTADMQTYVSKNSVLKNLIQKLIVSFSENLSELSESERLRRPYKPNNDLLSQYADIQNETKTLDTANAVYYDNILNNLNDQIVKIKSLERICTDKLTTSDYKIDDEDLDHFFKPNHYRFKTLLDNLNFGSTQFRYALRFTLAAITALLVSNLFNLKKEYWVLLTIVVIMRPGYGLTKSRLHQRIIGTIIGGLIGIVILYFVTKTTVIMVLMLLAMLLGFWFTSTDYKVGVTFITLYIILLYGLLKIDADQSVIYRITDTLIGAAISFLGTTFIWPSWEASSINNYLITSLQNTKAYVSAFGKVTTEEDANSFDLQKARQNAFIGIGNLMASYQRLVQEPKNKQKNRAQLYEVAVINQTLTDGVASLETFIKQHQDTDFYQKYNTVFNTIINNVNICLSAYGKTTNTNAEHLDYASASDISNFQIEQAKTIAETPDDQEAIKKDLIEEQLALSQLNWIVNLSDQMTKTVQSIQ